MKYFKTPNNDPFLAAILFMLLILISVLLFLALAQYFPQESKPAELNIGTGTGKGSGKGDGSGKGGGEGEGSGTGDHGTGVGDSKGSETGKGQDKGDGSGEQSQPKDQPAKDETAKDDTDAGKEQQKGDSQGSGADENSSKNKPEVKGQEIFIDSPKSGDDDNVPKKHGSRRGGSANSGKRSFSSGGKSVFNVKRHENVIFIVDISPSMSALTKEQISKIEILKIHLKAALGILLDNRSSGKYIILAFSCGTVCFPDDGTQLSFKSKQDFDKAIQWIDGIDRLPRSGTPLYGAMDKAAELIKQKNIKVDAVHVLTDGEPNDIRDPQRYIDLMRKKYPRRVKVHTIAIGKHSDLLKTIAKQGRGKYERFE